MYMTPTVTSWSNASPVRPSKSTVCPLVGRPASASVFLICVSCAPSKTGLA